MNTTEQRYTTEDEIRLNWLGALRYSKENDKMLSMTIGWGFTDQDIATIATIHELFPELRETIYDLLEDCNFHTENEMLEEGKYDKCREFALKDTFNISRKELIE